MSQENKEGGLLLAAIRQARVNFSTQIEVIAYKAMTCKAKYDEAKVQGFTSQEALEICTKPWSLE